MAKVKSGVFPVFDLDFKIGTKGKDSTEQRYGNNQGYGILLSVR